MTHSARAQLPARIPRAHNSPHAFRVYVFFARPILKCILCKRICPEPCAPGPGGRRGSLRASCTIDHTSRSVLPFQRHPTALSSAACSKYACSSSPEQRVVRRRSSRFWWAVPRASLASKIQALAFRGGPVTAHQRTALPCGASAAAPVQVSHLPQTLPLRMF